MGDAYKINRCSNTEQSIVAAADPEAISWWMLLAAACWLQQSCPSHPRIRARLGSGRVYTSPLPMAEWRFRQALPIRLRRISGQNDPSRRSSDICWSRQTSHHIRRQVPLIFQGFRRKHTIPDIHKNKSPSGSTKWYLSGCSNSISSPVRRLATSLATI